MSRAFGEDERQVRTKVANLGQKYYDEVFQHICEKGVSSVDAQDITQIVFERAYNHFLSKKEPVRSELAWLKGIAKNCICDFYKRQKKNLISLDSDESDSFPLASLQSNGLEKSVEQRMLLQQIGDELETLAPQVRRVMELTLVGYKPKEIAKRLHLGDSTVRSYLFEGREKIRPLLE